MQLNLTAARREISIEEGTERHGAQRFQFASDRGTFLQRPADSSHPIRYTRNRETRNARDHSRAFSFCLPNYDSECTVSHAKPTPGGLLSRSERSQLAYFCTA